MSYNAVADNTGLIHLTVVAIQICEIREIFQKFELIAVQGHRLVPIESAYALSYWSLIATLDVSPSVFEILTHLSEK